MKPFIICISGPSGSGKSLLVDNIISLVPQDKIAIIREDNYYQDLKDLKETNIEEINFDHPSAFRRPA